MHLRASKLHIWINYPPGQEMCIILMGSCQVKKYIKSLKLQTIANAYHLNQKRLEEKDTAPRVTSTWWPSTAESCTTHPLKFHLVRQSDQQSCTFILVMYVIWYVNNHIYVVSTSL